MSLQPEEIAALEDLAVHFRHFSAGELLFMEGERYEYAYLLEEGWAHRSAMLSDGRRQIFNFILPGEPVGLQHCLLGVSPQSVQAITECTVGVVPASALTAAMARYPGITTAFFWSAARELSILQDHMVSLGRRRAIEAVVHILLELQARLRGLGLDSEDFGIPLTQIHLGDALGLSTVHVNRTLRRLRDMGIIDVDDHHVYVLDPERAAELSEFEDRLPEMQATPLRPPEAYEDRTESTPSRPALPKADAAKRR